jgi:AcrR family transcriptional regulator
MGLIDRATGSKVKRRQRAKRRRQSSLRASEAILSVTVAVMGGNGDRKVTLNELAQRLNISPSTILHHFGIKDTLVSAAQARLNDPHYQLLRSSREMGTL